jgi:ADP-heptose:LPS heptosyltransferase
MVHPIESLRYRFHQRGIFHFFCKIRWKLNKWKNKYLWILNLFSFKLSVIDGYGALGDTIITSTFIHNIKFNYPNVRINLITPNASLLECDPNICEFNNYETFFSIIFWYQDIRNSKDGKTNVIEPLLRELGINNFTYKASIYLKDSEVIWAESELKNISKPIISINSKSNEDVKNWPVKNWQKLVENLCHNFTIIQLGDKNEPQLNNVFNFAGRTTVRESMALLKVADLHIGPDSFLIHAASGVNTPSVVIFGGSRTPINLGYQNNTNIFTSIDCAPCWIHKSDNEICQNNLKCMKKISVEAVIKAVLQSLKKNQLEDFDG